MIGPARRSSSYDVARVVAAKDGRSVAVVLPARNEEATVGPIVEAIRARLMEPSLGIVVDDLVVMDDQSTDRTAEVALAAGARVVSTADLGTEIAAGPGKGEALWKSLLATDADIVCWCDADVADFDGSYVLGLVGALCEDDHAVMAKGHYARPTEVPGADDVGGRVTELVVRPLTTMLHPDIAALVQPLSGEYAVKRAAVASLPFARGYAVDLALIIDVAATYGAESIVPVDLGVRRHRPQDILSLGAMATAITAMILRRSGVPVPAEVVLQQPSGPRTVPTPDDELPPIETLPTMDERRPIGLADR